MTNDSTFSLSCCKAVELNCVNFFVSFGRSTFFVLRKSIANLTGMRWTVLFWHWVGGSVVVAHPSVITDLSVTAAYAKPVISDREVGACGLALGVLLLHDVVRNAGVCRPVLGNFGEECDGVGEFEASEV